MTREEAQVITIEILEKLGDNYLKDGIVYITKNAMLEKTDNNLQEYRVFVHLISNTGNILIPIEYDEFKSQFKKSI